MRGAPDPFAVDDSRPSLIARKIVVRLRPLTLARLGDRKVRHRVPHDSHATFACNGGGMPSRRRSLSCSHRAMMIRSPAGRSAGARG
jgi:hypothetical protein